MAANLASLVHAKRLGLAVNSANGAFGLADDGVVALPEGLENGRTDREIPPHPVDLGERRTGRQRSSPRQFKIPAMERLRDETGALQEGFHRRSLDQNRQQNDSEGHGDDDLTLGKFGGQAEREDHRESPSQTRPGQDRRPAPRDPFPGLSKNSR